MGTRERVWLLSLAGAGLFAVSALALPHTSSLLYIPAYLGMATAPCAALAALRFPRRAATWGALAGGATGIVALFFAFILWLAAAEGGGDGALLLVSLGTGIAGLLVVHAAARGRAPAIARAEVCALTLVLVAALLEAFGLEDGDANLVGLTLIPAVVLGFALWQLRNEPPAARV